MTDTRAAAQAFEALPEDGVARRAMRAVVAFGVVAMTFPCLITIGLLPFSTSSWLIAALVLFLAGATVGAFLRGRAALLGAAVGGVVAIGLALQTDPELQRALIYWLVVLVPLGAGAATLAAIGFWVGRSVRDTPRRWLVGSAYGLSLASGFLAVSPLPTAMCAQTAPQTDIPEIVYLGLESQSYALGLHAVSADGTDVQLLPDGKGHPAWAPDGDSMAYAGSDTFGELGTFVARVDGTCPMRVADGESPAWSPDGRFVATRIWEDVSPQQIVITAVDVSSRRVLPAPGGDIVSRAAWSPDGNYLVVGGDQGLAVVRVDDLSTVRWLTRERAWAPAWSPDGAWIVFETGWQISVIPAEGGTERPLRTLPFALDPTWSPAGDEILYAASMNGADFHLAINALDTDASRDLFNAVTTSGDPSPSWRTVP